MLLINICTFTTLHRICTGFNLLLQNESSVNLRVLTFSTTLYIRIYIQCQCNIIHVHVPL